MYSTSRKSGVKQQAESQPAAVASRGRMPNFVPTIARRSSARRGGLMPSRIQLSIGGAGASRFASRFPFAWPACLSPPPLLRIAAEWLGMAGVGWVLRPQSVGAGWTHKTWTSTAALQPCAKSGWLSVSSSALPHLDAGNGEGGGESIRRRWSSRRTDGRSIRLIARDRGWQVRRTKVPGEAKTERAEIPHSRTTSIRRDPSSNSRSGTQLAGGLGHRALLLLAGLCTSYAVLPNDPSATL